MSEGKKTKRILCGALCAALVVGCIGGGIWWKGREKERIEKQNPNNYAEIDTRYIKESPIQFYKDASKYKGDIPSDELLSVVDIDLSKVVLPNNYKDNTLYLKKNQLFTKAEYRNLTLHSYPIIKKSNQKKIKINDTVTMNVQINDGKNKISFETTQMAINEGVQAHLIGGVINNPISFKIRHYGSLGEKDKKFSGKNVNIILTPKYIQEYKYITSNELTDQYVKNHFQNAFHVTTKKALLKKIDNAYYKRYYYDQKGMLIDSFFNQTKLLDNIKIPNQELSLVTKQENGRITRETKELCKTENLTYEQAIQKWYGGNAKFEEYIQTSAKQKIFLWKVIQENKMEINTKKYEKYLSENVISQYKDINKENYYKIESNDSLNNGEKISKLTYAETLAKAYLIANSKIIIN